MFERSVEILYESLAAKAFPSAAYAIGCHDTVYRKGVLGNRQELPVVLKADINTLYDLASISKIVATAPLALRFLEEGRIGLHDEIYRYFDCPDDKKNITVKQLITHSSGIKPYIMLEKVAKSPSETTEIILNSKLAYEPGTDAKYSCMGMILLAKILEKIGGKPLDELVYENVFTPLGMTAACYNPKVENVASTEYREQYKDVNGGYTKGFVHDENAYFQGGVSGNAGVFANIDDMIRYTRMISNRGKLEGLTFLTERTFDMAIHNWTPELSLDRGLGFQLNGGRYFPGGDLFSIGSYGHSGFTGTCVYVDKETGLWAIVLTNAVHYGRGRDIWVQKRRLFYNSVCNEFFRK